MIFDANDGDFIFPTSNRTGIDSKGNIIIRVGDNAALDTESGEIHFVPGWTDNNDDDNNDDDV